MTRQRGQATIEALLVASALLLIFSVPVTPNGVKLVALLTQLVSAWGHFQSSLWDALLLLPMVLK